jgi:hypothetical protein
MPKGAQTFADRTVLSHTHLAPSNFRLQSSLSGSSPASWYSHSATLQTSLRGVFRFDLSFRTISAQVQLVKLYVPSEPNRTRA